MNLTKTQIQEIKNCSDLIKLSFRYPKRLIKRFKDEYAILRIASNKALHAVELDNFNIKMAQASIPTKRLLEMLLKQLENTKKCEPIIQKDF
ncbi:hypothetical protein [Metamycoplasma equirhinis]|uniref:hypothetical protein n=1 Tax=Metamycoplasma equirhinis TaxID=92402 RepID=UPI00359377FC